MAILNSCVKLPEGTNQLLLPSHLRAPALEDVLHRASPLPTIEERWVQLVPRATRWVNGMRGEKLGFS